MWKSIFMVARAAPRFVATPWPLPPFTIRFVRFVAKYSRNVGTIKRRMSH
jgi:hypothetical protein